MTTITITSVAFTTARPTDQEAGLLGFLSLAVNDALLLDGITLRRTRSGRHKLSFPVRHDSRGNEHPFIRPVDDAARLEIERQVFDRLGIDQEVAP